MTQAERGRQDYDAVVAEMKVILAPKLLPLDTEQDYTPEQMEEAELETMALIDAIVDMHDWEEEGL